MAFKLPTGEVFERATDFVAWLLDLVRVRIGLGHHLEMLERFFPEDPLSVEQARFLGLQFVVDIRTLTNEELVRIAMSRNALELLGERYAED